MAKQIITITRITPKLTYNDELQEYRRRQTQGHLFLIHKSSIGYMWLNGVQYGYNTHLLANNQIDFSTPSNDNQSDKKGIIIFTRK